MLASLLVSGALAAAPAPQVGQSLRITSPTQGPIVGVLADVIVESEVHGDVVALGGNVRLGPSALVQGDVVALAGAIDGPGKVVGRTVTSGGGLLVSGRSGVGAVSRVGEWGAGLLRAGLWATLGILVLLLAQGRVRAVGSELVEAPARVFLIGVLIVIGWLAFAMLAVLVASTPVGAVLLLAAIAGLLLGKVLGIAAAGWALGRVIAPGLPLALRGEIARTGVALLLLALLSLAPLAGEPLWLLLSVTAIGSSGAAVLRRLPLRLWLPHLAVR